MESNIVKGTVVAALFIVCFGTQCLGQVEEPGIPKSFIMATTLDFQSVTMPPIDVEALLKQDSIDQQQGLTPFRFGYAYEVNFDLNNSGTWETLKDGTNLWRFRIECPGAYSINLIYDDFRLPPGARLFVYNEDRSMVIGAFSEKNNKEHGQFATRPVKGDVTILEYAEPPAVKQSGTIRIRRVVYGYKDVFGWTEKGFGDASICHINVNCPRGEPWKIEKRSVAMFILDDGTKGCSGTMVNQNVPPDEREQYFLTAAHCDVGVPETRIFFFNYESPFCESEEGPTNMTVVGSELIAKKRDTDNDFMLLKISEALPPAYKVYYSGWDTRDLEVPTAVGIHHPRSDIKKITFFPDGTHEVTGGWRVYMPDVWANGLIDHCSSGSPLFEVNNHRVIGIARWGHLNETDDINDMCLVDWQNATYSKFGDAMDDGAVPSERLRDWLDPHGGGVAILDGDDTYRVDACVILIDRTGSMNGIIPAGGTRFQRAKALATIDANVLFDTYPGVEVAVYSFYTEFDGGPYHFFDEIGTGFSDNRVMVSNAIANINPPLGEFFTPLAQAMIDGADLLEDLSSVPYRSLNVYTDGEENNSIHDASPVCGHCGPLLGGDPVSAHWNPECDPYDNDPPCDPYQTCLADAFAANSIVNVRYFGQRIVKQGVPGGEDMQDRESIAKSEIAEVAYAAAGEESLPGRQLPEYTLLQYIAEMSGGSFTFECDENQPPIALCKDVTIYTDEDCSAEVSIDNGSYDPDGDPVTLQLDPPPPYPLGQTLVTLTVTDPAGLTASCQATVTVLTHLVKIAKAHNVLQGHYQNVSITLENDPFEFGGFDFLIAYDASVLAFIEATPGQLLEDCDWEYFSYRYGADGNCGDACPSGLLRIIAIAETNNGPNHPSCLGPDDPSPHELAVLKFYVSNDRTFQCQFTPISFFWGDCGDNTISSVDGSNLYVSKCIYEFEGFDTLNIADDMFGFPTYFGVQQECFDNDPFKPTPIRFIDFVNGGIDIICSDSIDAKCDMNLNGIPYEIADAVFFTNCFISPIWCSEATIAASDCNGDGIPMSVADLVHLIRVITGDALPDPKLAPFASKASVSTMVNHSAAAVSTTSSSSIGAGYFVFQYSGLEIGEPQLINGASDMTLEYSDDGGVLKVLVYSMDKDVMIPAGTENIFAVPISGEGSIELREAELSDYYGNLLEATLDKKAALPKAFALHQNYPNPFNLSTTIIYELPEATDVTIEVFNVLGQKVVTLFEGRESAGVHSIAWEGNDESGATVSSGVYLYRITTVGFTAEKKMVLMK